MKIFGIDPGVAIVGWGAIEEDQKSINGLKYLGCGVIETDAGKKHPMRLAEIYVELTKILKKYSPDIIALEKLFFCKNLKTAISVGEARGVILLACENAGAPIVEYTPLEVKSAVCGYGKADKKQVQQMVKSILALDEILQPDDAADAVGIAICAASMIKTSTYCGSDNNEYRN